jgi:arsenate reductase
MSSTLLYHNPGCSKSRGALEILREREVEFEIVEYLEKNPDRATLARLLDLLPGPPTELFRVDGHFRELGLDVADYATSDAVIDLLLEHPRLIQRPIFVHGERAVIARPSEKLLELL